MVYRYHRGGDGQGGRRAAVALHPHAADTDGPERLLYGPVEVTGHAGEDIPEDVIDTYTHLAYRHTR